MIKRFRMNTKVLLTSQMFRIFPIVSKKVKMNLRVSWNSHFRILDIKKLAINKKMKVVKVWGLEKKRKWNFKAPHKGLIVALAFASHIIRARINHRNKAVPHTLIQNIKKQFSTCRVWLVEMLIHLRNSLEFQKFKKFVSFINFRALQLELRTIFLQCWCRRLERFDAFNPWKLAMVCLLWGTRSWVLADKKKAVEEYTYNWFQEIDLPNWSLSFRNYKAFVLYNWKFW